MSVVRLVCWNPELAQERARVLQQAGIVVDASPLNPASVIGHFRASSPAAVLIDLDRLPSHGREVAVALRSSKSTRHIPIVFVGGVPEKVERIRQELPDAVFTDWKRVVPALAKAVKEAPAEPVRPVAHMERYAGSSLVKKLGFKPKMKAALLGAPDGFEEILRELPEGVEMKDKLTRQTQLAIWFVRSRAELEAETDYISARLPEGCSLWIIHPKQTSRYKVDFNQNDVRAVGLTAGLVDYKVCAVDTDWTGLKFARKRSA
jgi:CheY-like chemotaxis protein